MNEERDERLGDATATAAVVHEAEKASRIKVKALNEGCLSHGRPGPATMTRVTTGMYVCLSAVWVGGNAGEPAAWSWNRMAQPPAYSIFCGVEPDKLLCLFPDQTRESAKVRDDATDRVDCYFCLFVWTQAG
jgi:hypothetical protein